MWRFDRLPLRESSGICLEFSWNWNLSFLDCWLPDVTPQESSPLQKTHASGATSGFHSFFFLCLQIYCCHGGLAASKHGGGWRVSPRCLFICTIISSCTKEQRQDIWCNTIAGSVPRGAPVCCVQSDHRTSSVQVAGPELLLPVTREPQRCITAAFLDNQCCRVIYYWVIY